MNFDTAQCSMQGARPYNEDSIFCTLVEQGLLALVADGLGGHGGGDVASQTAVKTFSAGFLKQPESGGAYLMQLAELANQAVLKQQTPGVRMKTTLAAFAALGGKYAVLHAGDSRCYVFRDGRLFHRTKDHSVPQMDVEAGRISEEKIRFHEDRNKVLKVLGAAEPLRPEVTAEGELRPGDGILLCSDGFWENVWENEMLADYLKARSAKDWLSYLLARLGRRLNDHSDNFSAVAILVKE